MTYTRDWYQLSRTSQSFYTAPSFTLHQEQQQKQQQQLGWGGNHQAAPSGALRNQPGQSDACVARQQPEGRRFQKWQQVRGRPGVGKLRRRLQTACRGRPAKPGVGWWLVLWVAVAPGAERQRSSVRKSTRRRSAAGAGAPAARHARAGYCKSDSDARARLARRASAHTGLWSVLRARHPSRGE